MTPFDLAWDWHFHHGGELEFSQVLEAHAQVGVVIVTQRVFWLARRVMRDWPEARLCNPWVEAANGDTWMVWLAAGDWRTWETYLPHELPWVGFHRRGKWRTWRLENFRRAKWLPMETDGNAAGHGIIRQETA